MAAGTDLESHIEQWKKVKDLIVNGMARARLDQPWTSATENKGVCRGFGIGREVCCRMLDRSQALFLRTLLRHHP